MYQQYNLFEKYYKQYIIGKKKLPDPTTITFRYEMTHEMLIFR